MNYRDDMTEGSFARSIPALTFQAWVDEDMSAEDHTRAGLFMAVTDGLQAASPSRERGIAAGRSDITAQDTLTVMTQKLHLLAQSFVSAVSDARAVFLANVDDTAQPESFYIGQFAEFVTDSARAFTTLSAHNSAAAQASSGIRTGDSLHPVTRWLIEESIRAEASETLQQRVVTLIEEALTAGDTAVWAQVARALAEARMIVTDEVQYHIHARLSQTERAFVRSSHNGGYGMAWTANADTWATSRYLPYQFDSIAVIDGALYGTCADGLYRLDDTEAVEQIHAMIRTGEIEVSPDTLARLDAVYCVYEADADIQLTVQQTQAGQAESYTYPLPQRTADTLTTNRFKTGRGLRGRRFTFTLDAQGERANFIELELSLAGQKRKIY